MYKAWAFIHVFNKLPRHHKYYAIFYKLLVQIQNLHTLSTVQFYNIMSAFFRHSKKKKMIKFKFTTLLEVMDQIYYSYLNRCNFTTVLFNMIKKMFKS